LVHVPGDLAEQAMVDPKESSWTCPGRGNRLK
jgi:hypothetical protein